MSVYKIEEIAERVRPIAERYNIPKVYLFGSYARGEATEGSDVDLLIDADNVFGLEFFGLRADLEDALGKELDIITIAECYNIPKVYLFGSYARGEATEESDIDLLIDAQNIKGLFELGGVYADLGEALNKEIDLVTIEALNEHKNDPLTVRFVKEISREEKLIYQINDMDKNCT